MDSLRRAGMESIASSSHGEELAGILYGHATKEGWQVMLWRAIPRKSPRPAALPLNDAEEAVARRMLKSKGLKAIGFFHSRTSGERSLEPEEIQLGASLFPSQACVAIVLRPRNQRPVTATFFIASSDVSTHGVEVILEPTQEPPVQRQEEVPLPVFLSSSSPTFQKQERREGWNWPASLAAFVVGALLALPVGFVLVDQPLKLDASVDGERLVISWNRFSGILSQATGAELEVDGRPKELTVDQLRAGGVETSAPSGDFKVRLRLRGPYAESQRAIVTMVQP